MKNRRMITFVIVMIAVFSAASIAVAAALMYKPAPNRPTEPEDTSEGPGVGRSDPEQTVKNNVPDTSDEIRYKENCYNILVAGLDSLGGNHTDVLMLVSYDANKKTASILSIPRDTYINVGRNFSRINAFYTGEYNRLTISGVLPADARPQAMSSFCGFLSDTLGVQIDYYVTVNIAGFRNIVDLLGGVEVDIPADMDYDDPDQNLHIHLKRGVHLLNGEDAEGFVRFRSGYAEADIGRINAQKIFITAMLKQVKKTLSPSTLSGIIDQATENISTSMSTAELLYFAKEALAIEYSNVTFVTMPGEALYNAATGAWYQVIYRSAAREIINRYVNIRETDIPDAEFDPDRIFTNENIVGMNEIYTLKMSGDACDDGLSADEIDKGSIDIVRND